MKQLQQMTRLLAAGLMLSGLSVATFAQEPQTPPVKEKQEKADPNERDRMASTTMIGCLNKDTSGAFTLTDESTGAKTTVSGGADLEKHSTNHKVTLTGLAKAGSDGKSIFEVTKLEHMSDTCKAPAQ